MNIDRGNDRGEIICKEEGYQGIILEIKLVVKGNFLIIVFKLERK